MEKSKIVRKVAVLIGGIAMMAALPACGVAGIMDPTDSSPRADPAVESGQVENPVEIRDGEGTFAEDQPEERRPDSESFEQSPPDGSPPEGFPERNIPEGTPFDEDADDGRDFGQTAPRPGFSPGGFGGPKGKGPKGGGVSAEMLGSLEPVEDAVRRVGDAGEVEFRVENGVLNLVDVSANSGWDYQLGKQEFDEAKVFFIGEDAQWEFEAEIKEGYLLEVETKREIPFAEPGSYEVGEAGEVSFSADGGGIVLDDYKASDGWRATIEENDFEDVHLKFYNEGGVEYKFEAELDDGSVEVNIDRKERGPLAAG